MILATLVFAGAAFIRRRISFTEGVLYVSAYVLFVIVVAGVLTY